MRFMWPSIVFGLLINVSSQVEESRQEKQSTSSERLEERADDLTELYVIYPKDVTVKSQADAINRLLDQYVSPGNKSSIYASECNNHGMWTLFWDAPLSESHAKILRDDPNASPLPAKDTLVRQRYSPEEMKFLSQPEDLKLGNFENYVYQESGGRDVLVYISDTGANLANTEFTEITGGSNIARRVRWLFGQGGGAVDTDEVDLSPKGHGSCVLDKIGGYRYGVAKNANPVVVRAVRDNPLTYLDTVRKIDADYQAIYDRDPKNARAIVNLSWGWTKKSLEDYNPDAWINEMRRLLKGLINNGATIVVPTGNALGATDVDKWPTLFAGEEGDDGIPELIVVGGIEVYDFKNGKLWDRSQKAPYVDLYAPSYLINCVDGAGGMRNRLETTGTSFAAAQVSGMAAYFLGISGIRDKLRDDDGRTRSLNLKNHLISYAYARDKTAGDFKAIYNGEDPRECRKSPKDDDKDVGEPCRPSTTAPSNDMTIMGDCFIETVTPSASPSPTPEIQCSCAGGMVAGVTSTEVMGTTYSWCQTGGPPVYPTGMQTVVSPAASPPEPTDPPAPRPPPKEDDGKDKEKPKGKCNKDDASPLNVGDDC
ncbi:MAG: hypothetical protein Q9168_001831 [Polycauliona sp. 1 TL-2023]